MLKIANEVFGSRNEPGQLQVNDEVMKKLKRLHPAAVIQHCMDDGPITWLLLIPTTVKLMEQFVQMKISEQELLEYTPLNANYDALYLCSVMTLPEYRNAGHTKAIVTSAIEQVRASYPIRFLFVWPFSMAGAQLATEVAMQVKLPLLKREAH
jgi:hypothetical protein